MTSGLFLFSPVRSSQSMRAAEASRCTGLSAPFIRRPVATTLIMVAILLVGLVAYPYLPVAPLPQVDFPTISVSASLPGASPETMAASVAQPLERQIAQIPGVSQMTSTSALGVTGFTVQFDLNRNIDAAANDIQAAINAAAGQLPKDLPSPPTYRKVNPSDTPVLILSVCQTSSRSSMSTTPPKTSSPSASARSRASPSCESVASRRQPFAFRSTRPSSSKRACSSRMCARRSASRPPTARRARSLDPTDLHDLRQRPADRSEVLERRDHRLPQRRAGARARHRQSGRRPGRTRLRRPGAMARAASFSSCASSRARMSSTRSRRSRAAGPSAGVHPDDHSCQILSDRTNHPRLGARRPGHAALTIGLVVMVIFVFLRSVWATIIPGVTVPLALLAPAH